LRSGRFVFAPLLLAAAAHAQAPVRVSIAPAQIAAGSGDTRIKISGYSFTANTQVLWNGHPRATQFVNDFLLKTTITQADLAAPGLAQVSIVDSTSGQTFSVPFPVLVYLPLANNDLTYDPSRDKIYVSVSQQDPNGPSLAIVDPERGIVERYLPLPSEPGALALTADSNILYIGMSDRIRRMDLTGSTPAVDIPASVYHAVSANAPGQTPYLPVSLLPLPNQPASFIVTVNADGAYLTAVVDGTTLRPVGSTFGRCLAGSSPNGTTIYSGPGLIETNLDAPSSSFVLPYENDSLDAGPNCPVYANGLMYGSDGDVVDVASQSRVQWLPALGNLDVVPQTNEVRFLDQGGNPVGNPNLVFKTFDSQSGSLLKSIPLGIQTSIANGGEVHGHLIHWGTNGIGFGDYSTLNSSVAKWIYLILVP
jgi:hypothetical protein